MAKRTSLTHLRKGFDPAHSMRFKVTRRFDDDAQVVWLATFTDKTTAMVTLDVP